MTESLLRPHWGIPNLLVLTVTTSESRMTEILRRLEHQTTGSAGFLFKTIGEGAMATPRPSLLIEAWERAGHAPFGIAAPG